MVDRVKTNGHKTISLRQSHVRLPTVSVRNETNHPEGTYGKRMEGGRKI